MTAHAATAEEIPKTETVRPVVRFLQGANLLGQTPYVPGNTLVEHAEDADVSIPTNCTSGTCGTCMVTLLYGEMITWSKNVQGLHVSVCRRAMSMSIFDRRCRMEMHDFQLASQRLDYFFR